MLRLEKLEMAGFKSFFSRTEFLFDKEITAVVGPNGCGKSNIGDALNWVIGEQSVKSLRGDRMEDVIFNGSEGRRPLGMAEVSLHLRNGAGSGAEETVVITRRLFRSGESEYLVNGQRSRLRDVQETLARVNVGSGVYSIIEQGKVDAALSSRPRERRILLEEAAGIALYKARKRQAEAKLEATEANLLRLNDIVAEIERQIGSLKRQAARARRYGLTIEEIARHERILLCHEHGRLQRELQEVGAREEAARAEESGAAAALAGLEARFEEGRSLLEEEDSLWRRQREELHALEREMDRQEREMALARDQAIEAASGVKAALEESAALAARVEEVGRQVEARRADRAELDRRASAEASQQERLETSRRALEERIASLESELSGRRAALLQAIDALSEARNRCRQVEEAREKLGRHEAALEREDRVVLEEIERRAAARAAIGAELEAAETAATAMAAELQARREGVGKLEEALVRETKRREESRHRLHGHEERLRALQELEATSGSARELLEGVAAHEGILADGLKAPADLEAAVEAYLDRMLDAALVPGLDPAFQGIASLKRSGSGRVGFLPVPDGAAEAPPHTPLPEEVRSDPALVGRLADLIEIDARRRCAMAPALGRALVAADLEGAFRLRKAAPLFDYITLDGDVLHATGLIEGGARRADGAGLLTRRRLESDLRLGIETGRAHVEGLDALVAGLESDRSSAAAAAARIAEELAAREKELVALRLTLQAAAEEESRASTRAEAVARERIMAGQEAAALRTESGRLTATLADLEEARRSREAEIAGAQEEIARLRGSAAAMGESLATVRASLSAARQRLEALDMELSRMLETDQELRDRLGRETSREADHSRRGEEAAGREAAAATALHELAARRSGLEAAVRDGEVVLGEKRRDLEARAREVREARTALEETRGSRERITLEQERVASDLRHLLTGAAAPGGPSVEKIFGSITEEERSLDIDAVQAVLAELREKRDRMGPVNMLALEEFKELEERYSFLTAQRKDLSDAIASLKETIARINRTSRERFLDAFEKIRAGFGETFRTLFGGGRADLRLMTEEGEEDILECGLEIIAQPPGKRLQSVTLLSGGEKALTAIALLFAIFKFRPSPFCLLDEVDAPLDEANVIRFNELLKSMAGATQFVLITHNRCSMEAAEVLYGITMEEPGVSRTMSVVLDGNPDRAETVRTLPALLAARHRGGGRRRAASSGNGGNGGPGGDIAPGPGNLPA